MLLHLPVDDVDDCEVEAVNEDCSELQAASRVLGFLTIMTDDCLGETHCLCAWHSRKILKGPARSSDEVVCA